jgi:hypothetical protein
LVNIRAARTPVLLREVGRRIVTGESGFQIRNPAACPALSDCCTFHDAQGEIRMLISVLITFLVVILILYLINLLPIDGRAKQIARVVVIILGVISLLKYIAVF